MKTSVRKLIELMTECVTLPPAETADAATLGTISTFQSVAPMVIQALHRVDPDELDVALEKLGSIFMELRSDGAGPIVATVSPAQVRFETLLDAVS